jgi:excisionase family DNA binding protein
MPEHHAEIHHIDRQPERRSDRQADTRTLKGLPLMLTIEEAAGILRISRTSAYKLAEEYRRSGGSSGLPHVRLGSRLLVRRADLAEITGTPPDAA